MRFRKIICVIIVVSVMLSIVSTSTLADENAPLTRLRAVKLLERILPCYGGGTPFDDTSDPTVLYYRRMGITNGVEGNNFVPDRLVSTQEFLSFLKRTLDVACPDLFYDNRQIKWHYDQNEVLPYYQTQIAFLSTVGVYNNSGYLKPTSIISEGMASYYINLAVRAKEYGKRSKNGVAPAKMPPVLMYHIIGNPIGQYPYLYVSKNNFEAQIKYLYDNGYAFLFPEEISLASEIPKSVVITIDDGFRQIYDIALPILKKYNAKATLYVVTDKIGTSDYCTAEELRYMNDTGVFRIYSHTKKHPYLTSVDKERLDWEFENSNNEIYNITKREVTSIAYPHGYYDDKVIAEAKRYYKNAFSVKDTKNDMFSIARKTIDDSLSIPEFAKRLK